MSIPDNARLIVLDTETSGITDQDGVCDIAWVELDEGFNILDERQSLIDPECEISPGASGVHGLVNADVEHAPTLAEYFGADDPSCYGESLVGPVVLIGHRIGFDVRFVGKYVPDLVQEIDTLRWAKRLYPDSDNHQLQTMIFALDLPRSAGAHRAMADVMSAMHLARHICDRTGMGLRQLAEASAEPMLLTYHSFGKHKGTRFDATPKSYLRWMSENIKDMDMDLRFTLDTLLKIRKAPAQQVA